jgi:hypothetical protein
LGAFKYTQRVIKPPVVSRFGGAKLNKTLFRAVPDGSIVNEFRKKISPAESHIIAFVR